MNEWGNGKLLARKYVCVRLPVAFIFFDSHQNISLEHIHNKQPEPKQLNGVGETERARLARL